MSGSYQEMVAEARGETEQVSVDDVHEAIGSGEDVLVLAVREPDEWEEGHVPNARLIPRSMLEYLASEELPDSDRRIVVHCAAGGRGALATRTLQDMGYTNVANMEGGMNTWRERGYEVEPGG